MDSTACDAEGSRIRTRDCEKDGAAADDEECPGEALEIVQCTPKTCLNIACDCDVGSTTYGTKNGVCSGKVYISLVTSR